MIRTTSTFGYTIVEVLVAIAIVAIVAAITVPVVSSAKKSAKASKTLRNLKSLHAGAMLYQADYQGAVEGTPEEMGLPTWEGTVFPYYGTKNYLQPWYADMKSPFGVPGSRDYRAFLIPGALDRLPVTWAQCTRAKRDACILYFDRYEPGFDARTGQWISDVNHVQRRLHGIALAGNIVTRDSTGNPHSQAWWIPNFYGTNQ
jgi:prepilin-type N-terminal cleavage/methylation domain-containing protein